MKKIWRKSFFLLAAFFLIHLSVVPMMAFGANQNDIALIQKDVEEFDGVYNVIVIKGKKDTLVTYKVKQLKRFRMKKIEKEIKNQLKKKYSDEKFTVSSDFKIYLEADRLRKKMKDPKFNEQKLEKRLRKILKLEKEQT